MSASHAATAHAIPAAPPRLAKAGPFLVAGAALAALALAGALLGDPKRVAFSWLIGVSFWSAISLGVLLLVMIHHIFDAGWSTILRRPMEHWLAAFPVLAVAFAPLLLVSLFVDQDIIWKWLDHDRVAGDILWVKKAAFLSPVTFTISSVVFFGAWIWLSSRLRRHSFAQDEDGLVEHTHANRRTAAFGIPLTALTLTGAALYWMMSLEYHWFSTMYGVWYFANSMRAALALLTILALYLVSRGVFDGIFKTAHLLNLGNIMLAFTVFWAYVTFSQYFLIWNANIPEETFWYNLRELNLESGERNSWWHVGMVLLFGHFFLPFFFFLGHHNKKSPARMTAICLWILAIVLLDMFYNILPSIKLPSGDAVPFGVTLWDVAAVASIGALCFWAFLRSFGRTRCIPIRDPRIVESLNCHE